MDGYEVHIGIDWGTWSWSAACTVSRNGKQVVERHLLLFEGSHEVRMIATWLDDGRFVHGAELETLARDDQSLSDCSFEFFKLGLYPGRDTREQQLVIKSILENRKKTFDELITAHLKAIMAQIKIAVLESNTCKNAGFQPHDLIQMKHHVRITVPQMWTPLARRRMQTAAKAAGLELCHLSKEPTCALAYLVSRRAGYITNRQRPLQKGSKILVMDVGCGTADFVLYELKDDLSVNSRFDAVASSSGGICGAFQVDRSLRDILLQRKGEAWATQTAERLQVSTRDFERRILRGVEATKRKFNQQDPVFPGYIWGTGGRYENFDLTQEDIRRALDETIQNIFTKADDMVQHHGMNQVNLVYAVGGFSKNQYFLTRLIAKYANSGTMVVRPDENESMDLNPIAMGALCRYENISPQNLPLDTNFCILGREVFDPKIHTDSVKAQPKRPKPAKLKRRAANRRRRQEISSEDETEDETDEEAEPELEPWVQNDPYDPSILVVDDRLEFIVRKGQKLASGQCVLSKEQGGRIYFIPVADPNPSISVTAVYTKKDYPDYVRAMDYYYDQDGNELKPPKLREGITKWADMTFKPDKTEMNKCADDFEIISVNGTDYYKIFGRFFIECVGDDLQAGIELLKMSKKKGNDFKAEVALTARDSLYDSKHSPFTRD